EQVKGRLGTLTSTSHSVEKSSERDVVDVMSCLTAHRSVLAPPGHPPVDDSRISRQDDVRAETEPLGHARPKPLDKDVGAVDQREYRFLLLGLLEIRLYQYSIAELRVPRTYWPEVVVRTPDARDFGTEVPQDHRRVRPRPDSRKFDDTKTGKRATSAHLTRWDHG